jgi:hypothetical protein
LQKRWVKRIVNIPKRKHIANISKAWDYAGKVCLRLREDTILFPPSSDFDEKFAKSIYNSFDFIPATQEHITAFELRHISTPAKNIKARKKQLSSELKRTTERKEWEPDDYISNKYPFRKTIHTQLPIDSGRITKASIAFLYAAIICFIMRDKSEYLPLPIEVANNIMMSIYCHFSLVEEIQDLRHYRGWNDLLKIMLDIENHGYNAAAKMNPSGTTFCKNCSNIRKGHFVSMEAPESENEEWMCPQCQGSEQLQTYYSAKHLKNIYGKTWEKIEENAKYLPIFEQVKEMYRYASFNDKEDITKRFREYELLAEKDLLSKHECYFMVHYDSSKKWKKRSCYIPNNMLHEVEIRDFRYNSLYKPLIKQLMRLHNSNGAYFENRLLFARILHTLKIMGWPQRYLSNKILADCLSS